MIEGRRDFLLGHATLGLAPEHARILVMSVSVADHSVEDEEARQPAQLGMALRFFGKDLGDGLDDVLIE